jgi:hypothetical protein
MLPSMFTLNHKPSPFVALLLQFGYERRVAEMVLGCDAAALGGAVANSGGWLKASDETHCGKMVALQVRCSALL